MNTNLAMLIIGSVLIIIGLIKNLIPVKFNESIFGKIEGKAENYAAAMRTNIGALLIGMGIVLLMNRNDYDPNHLLLSIGISLSIFLLSIISFIFLITANLPGLPTISPKKKILILIYIFQ